MNRHCLYYNGEDAECGHPGLKGTLCYRSNHCWGIVRENERIGSPSLEYIRANPPHPSLFEDIVNDFMEILARDKKEIL
jgi:hypothetical protein